MANQDPRANLRQAQNLAQGKGFFGWLTRLFMGKQATAQMSADIDQASGLLDQAEVQRRVLATGAPAQAVVRAIQDTGAMVNFDPVVDLLLEVHTPGQPAFQVHTRTTVSKIAVPRMNETVQIKYNPQNPRELAIVQ